MTCSEWPVPEAIHQEIRDGGLWAAFRPGLGSWRGGLGRRGRFAAGDSKGRQNG